MTPKLYKAGEVCELVQVQLYVLRSWEKEFPGIGIQKSPESPRLYRQSDLEHVQQIKQLVFGEGLTVSGARRRLDETTPAVSAMSASEAAEVLDTLSADARARIVRVRDGLREIRSLLSAAPGSANGNMRSRHDGEGSRVDRSLVDRSRVEADLEVGRRSGRERVEADLQVGRRSGRETGSKGGRKPGAEADLQGRHREFVLKPPSEKPARAKARPAAARSNAAARSKTVKRGAAAKASSAGKKGQTTKRKRTHA